jgi:hypothetical protein
LTQAGELAAALLALDELLDDDEDAVAEPPFDDDWEPPLLDDPPSEPPLPAGDVAPEVDELSLVDADSFAGVVEGPDLSDRESFR